MALSQQGFRCAGVGANATLSSLPGGVPSLPAATQEKAPQTVTQAIPNLGAYPSSVQNSGNFASVCASLLLAESPGRNASALHTGQWKTAMLWEVAGRSARNLMRDASLVFSRFSTNRDVCTHLQGRYMCVLPVAARRTVQLICILSVPKQDPKEVSKQQSSSQRAASWGLLRDPERPADFPPPLRRHMQPQHVHEPGSRRGEGNAKLELGVRRSI